MSTETKVLGIIFIITILVLFGGIFWFSRNQSASSGIKGATVSQIDYNKGQKIGSSSATVKLVEFSDFQCPACRSAEPALKQTLSKYPDGLQFIYRHFPLPQHIHARQAAALAEVAGEQGKFWEMHDKVFETQDQWSDLTDATAFFLDLAKQLDLDEDKVRQALEGNTFGSKIDDDKLEGQRLGVSATPTFFLNGRRLSLQTFNDLERAVAEELGK